MKRHVLFICAAVALTLALAGAAAAETLIVFPFSAPAQYQHDARIMQKMLKNELENLPNTTLYGTQDATCATIACAKKIRQQRGVDAVVVGEVTTFGGALTLLIDVVWADEVLNYNPGLADVNEFKKVKSRLAKAIRNRDSWEGQRGVDSVAREEQHPYKQKVHGMWRFGAGLAMLAPLADTYLGASYLIGGKLMFRYEIAKVGIEGAVGYLGSSNLAHGLTVTEVPIEIGAHYYLLNSDISPFIGAAFGAHAVFLDHADTDGYYAVDDNSQDYWMFTVAPYAGLELLRTHTFVINFRAGYRYGFVDFDEVEADKQLENGAHGPFLQVGILFGGS